MLKALSTVGGFTLGSRIIGYLREVITAALLGAGPIADALVASIKLPSLMRRLFAEGALNAVFVPSFTRILMEKGKPQAISYAEEIFSLLSTFLLILLILIEIVFPSIAPFLVPGFIKTPDRFQYYVEFSRYTLPFIYFISLTALYSGILNSFERFAFVASSPLIGNLCIVSCALLFARGVSDPGSIMAIAITAGGISQMLWVLWPCHRQGLLLKWRWPRLTPAVKIFLAKFAPIALGSGVHQINIVIGTVIASMLPTGGVAYLHYAERLAQLPVSVIGTSMTTVLLPLLTKQIKAAKTADIFATQQRGIEIGLIFSIGSLLGLGALSHPLVITVFGHGNMTLVDCNITAAVLMGYVVGLPAYILSKVFITTFYAHLDTRCPLYCSLASVGVDVILSLLLIRSWGAMGIAIATSMAAWTNVILLASILFSKKWVRLRLHSFLTRLLAASICTYGVVYNLQGFFPFSSQAEKWSQFLNLCLVGGTGFFTYCVTLFMVGIITFQTRKGFILATSQS